MGWLYGQTWLWYLLAFAVGVLLAWLLLVRPAQRRLRAAGERTGHAPARSAAAPAAVAEAPARRNRADEVVTEQFPAVDPALSTLDHSAGSAGIGAAGVAALGAAGVVAGSQRDGGDDRDSDRDTDSDTTRIPVVPPQDRAEPGSADETAQIPVVPPQDRAEPGSADETAQIPVVPPAAPGAQAESRPEPDGATTTPDAQGPVAAPVPAQDTAGEVTPVHDTPVHDTPEAHADGGSAAPAAVVAGRFPGSALPLDDGAAPTAEHTIKGNAQSMLYHTTASPYYTRTKAEVWFTSTADAEAAGFTDVRSRKR